MIKQYVYHVTTNDVDPTNYEDDDDIYYRVNAATSNQAIDQMKRDIPNLVFFELIKTNI